jgi:hypothetical protein
MRVPRFIVRQYQDTRNYNEYPAYWRVLQILLGVGVGAGLLVYFLLPDHSAEQKRRADAWSRVQASAVQPVTGAGDPSKNPTSVTTKVVLSDGSGSVDLPLAAVDTAKAAARSLFTGDFSTVLVGPGVATPPPPQQRWTDPQIADPTVESVTDSRVAFAVVVDPDGKAGPEGARKLVVSAILTDGHWAYGG